MAQTVGATVRRDCDDDAITGSNQQPAASRLQLQAVPARPIPLDSAPAFQLVVDPPPETCSRESARPHPALAA
jgi:hypothetical protein